LDASVEQLYSKFGFNSLKNTFLQLRWRIRFACLIYRHRREALRAGTQQFTNWRGGISLSLFMFQNTLLQRRSPWTKHTEASPIMRAISNTCVSLSQSIGISLRRFSRVRRRVRIYVRTCATRFVHRGQTFHTMHFHLNVIRSFSGSAELTPSLFMGNHVQSGSLTEANQVCSHRHRTLWIPT